MLSAFQIIRAATFPLQPTGGYIKAKQLFNTYYSDDNKDGRENNNNELYPVVPNQDPNQSFVCPQQCHVCSVFGGNANMYDTRKYGHDLPRNNSTPCFQPLQKMPTDIFRYTVGECLGPQGHASKYGLYLNPEYFSFHHMTFYDIHLLLRKYRKPSPKSGRKP